MRNDGEEKALGSGYFITDAEMMSRWSAATPEVQKAWNDFVQLEVDYSNFADKNGRDFLPDDWAPSLTFDEWLLRRT